MQSKISLFRIPICLCLMLFIFDTSFCLKYDTPIIAEIKNNRLNLQFTTPQFSTRFLIISFNRALNTRCLIFQKEILPNRESLTIQKGKKILVDFPEIRCDGYIFVEVSACIFVFCFVYCCIFQLFKRALE